jgi:hypothetical protein
MAGQLLADVIETRNGARIVGKILKIDAGVVTVDTDYAGAIAVKQASVASISTDDPVAVRLTSGTRIDGTVTGTGSSLQVQGADGTITTTVDKVAAFWKAGERDPAVVALDRTWAFEASADIAGTTGNQDQLGTAASITATLASATDKLVFYSAYNRQVTDDAKSADQFKAGVDYSNNFSGAMSWYVRDEGGFDRIKDIELYNVAGIGLGYDVIKKINQTLTLRGGLSYRYEGYKNPATDSVNSAGLDFGLQHELVFGDSKLVNSLTFVPSFNNFSNFRATHASYYEIPMLNPAWKLRLGLSNDYNSKPGAGIKKLDTTYFTRFVLSWK